MGREAHIYKGFLKTLNDSSFCSTTTRGESSLLSVCRLETQERCGFSAAADGRVCSPLIAVSDAYLASHGGVSPKHLRCESCARPKSAKKTKDVGGGMKAAFCCDECWSDCVWRKRSQGLSAVSSVKIMM